MGKGMKVREEKGTHENEEKEKKEQDGNLAKEIARYATRVSHTRECVRNYRILRGGGGIRGVFSRLAPCQFSVRKLKE